MRSTKFTVADLKRGLARLGCVRERSSGAKLIYSFTRDGRKTSLPPFMARRDAAEVNMNEVTKLRNALALLHLDLWSALADDLPKSPQPAQQPAQTPSLPASYRDAVVQGPPPPALPPPPSPSHVDRKLAEFAGWVEDPPKPKRKPGSPIPVKDKLEAVRQHRELLLTTPKGLRSVAASELAARLGYAWSDMYRWDRLLRDAGHLGLPIPDAAVAALEGGRRKPEKKKPLPLIAEPKTEPVAEEVNGSGSTSLSEIEAFMRAGDIFALDDLLKARNLTLSQVREMMTRSSEIESIRKNPEAALDRIRKLEERVDRLMKDLGVS